MGFLLHAIQIFLNNTVEKAEAHLNKLPKVPQLVSSSAYFIFKKTLIWLHWVLVAALRRLVGSGRIFCCSARTLCGIWALQCLGSVVAARGLRCLLACGILVPRPGIELMPPALEDGVLTAGPLGESQDMLLLTNILMRLLDS